MQRGEPVGCSMKILSVYYTQAAREVAERSEWEAAYRWLLDNLPPARRARLERIRHRPSRTASAAGLLLLHHAMRASEHPDFNLRELVFPEDNSKPLCPGRCDFNISHSHEAVFCALAGAGRVGVDVERVREIEAGLFERMISEDELESAGGGETAFFTCWTRKEAVIKAHGGSGVWHMPRVRLEGDRAFFRDRCWHLHPLPAADGYAAALATDRPGPAPDCRFVDFRRLVRDVAGEQRGSSRPGLC